MTGFLDEVSLVLSAANLAGVKNIAIAGAADGNDLSVTVIMLTLIYYLPLGFATATQQFLIAGICTGGGLRAENGVKVVGVLTACELSGLGSRRYSGL